MKSSFFKGLIREEDGAVTIDWTVITAALVALALAVTLSIGNGTQSLADELDDHMSTQEIGS